MQGFGGVLIVQADETVRHAHLVWDCRDHNGVPMSCIMKGSGLQDIAAEVIAKNTPEIERGVRKSELIARGGRPSQIYVQQLYQDLHLELKGRRIEVSNLKDRVEEYNAAKANLDVKAQQVVTNDTALKIKERVLNTAEDQLDDRKMIITLLDTEVQVREAGASRREGILGRMADDISLLINDITDRLGVGKPFRAIRDRLKPARNDSGGERPSFD